MTTILVVDDKYPMRQLLEEYLTKQGFQVITAADGHEALFNVRHTPPDLILLDIMMPRMDGYEFLRQYRKIRATPVIILTALEAEKDAVRGLELGADDYVTKPFRLHELTARIRAVLRRTQGREAPGQVMKVGEICLDDITHSVTVRGGAIRLTPLEFELLKLLMTSPGRVYTRDQIIDELSLKGFSGLARTLNVHVRNLRTKIEYYPDQPQYIETVFGVGYRLCNSKQ